MSIQIEFSENVAHISGEYISPKLLFESGQSFRFEPITQDCYIGVAGRRVLQVEAKNTEMLVYPASPEDRAFLSHYFDLSRSYTEIEAVFAKDEILQKTLGVCAGLRILNQDSFETTISFIISANNNIPRIRSIIKKLCLAAGERIEGEYFAFPEPKALFELGERKLRELGCGYRAPYIEATAKLCAEGFEIGAASSMECNEAVTYLRQLPGVGPKVAHCIALFSCGQGTAFPKDTWIRKVLKECFALKSASDHEIDAALKERFGGQAGVAQQYLFYWARMGGLRT